jgi:multicomponent Na+:H+ antiporter subunit F
VYGIVVVAILLTMSLALVRAARGPTVFDRILALNMFGTKTVLLICVFSFMIERTDFLDLALLYSLMSFIGIVAVLRFSKYGHFGDAESSTERPMQGANDGSAA